MGRKVLVVDDEKLIVKGLRFSLEQDDMEVDCAYDGEEALEMVKRKEYDMILLDVMLPKYDGFEVCRQIRDFSDVPVIMLTAKGEDMDKILGLEYASILLCVVLHGTSKLYTDYINNPYIRIIIAGTLVIAMRYIFGTTDYLGAGSDIIARSFVTSCAWYVFLLKMLFTAVTLGGGFKGGEIVPTLFVGATLGSFLAPIFGLPVGLCAACGMVSVFCGVTNCPLTSFILSIEMFGASTMKFTILCIALSYLLSGYYSLYNSQKIVYSKYKTEYINRRSH